MIINEGWMVIVMPIKIYQGDEPASESEKETINEKIIDLVSEYIRQFVEENRNVIVENMSVFLNLKTFNSEIDSLVITERGAVIFEFKNMDGNGTGKIKANIEKITYNKIKEKWVDGNEDPIYRNKKNKEKEEINPVNQIKKQRWALRKKIKYVLPDEFEDKEIYRFIYGSLIFKDGVEIEMDGDNVNFLIKYKKYRGDEIKKTILGNARERHTSKDSNPVVKHLKKAGNFDSFNEQFVKEIDNLEDLTDWFIEKGLEKVIEQYGETVIEKILKMQEKIGFSDELKEKLERRSRKEVDVKKAENLENLGTFENSNSISDSRIEELLKSESVGDVKKALHAIESLGLVKPFSEHICEMFETYLKYSSLEDFRKLDVLFEFLKEHEDEGYLSSLIVEYLFVPDNSLFEKEINWLLKLGTVNLAEKKEDVLKFFTENKDLNKLQSLLYLLKNLDEDSVPYDEDFSGGLEKLYDDVCESSDVKEKMRTCQDIKKSIVSIVSDVPSKRTLKFLENKLVSEESVNDMELSQKILKSISYMLSEHSFSLKLEEKRALVSALETYFEKSNEVSYEVDESYNFMLNVNLIVDILSEIDSEESLEFMKRFLNICSGYVKYHILDNAFLPYENLRKRFLQSMIEENLFERKEFVIYKLAELDTYLGWEYVGEYGIDEKDFVRYSLLNKTTDYRKFVKEHLKNVDWKDILWIIGEKNDYELLDFGFEILKNAYENGESLECKAPCYALKKWVGEKASDEDFEFLWNFAMSNRISYATSVDLESSSNTLVLHPVIKKLIDINRDDVKERVLNIVLKIIEKTEVHDEERTTMDNMVAILGIGNLLDHENLRKLLQISIAKPKNDMKCRILHGLIQYEAIRTKETYEGMKDYLYKLLDVLKKNEPEDECKRMFGDFVFVLSGRFDDSFENIAKEYFIFFPYSVCLGLVNKKDDEALETYLELTDGSRKKSKTDSDIDAESFMFFLDRFVSADVSSLKGKNIGIPYFIKKYVLEKETSKFNFHDLYALLYVYGSETLDILIERLEKEMMKEKKHDAKKWFLKIANLVYMLGSDESVEADVLKNAGTYMEKMKKAGGELGDNYKDVRSNLDTMIHFLSKSENLPSETVN